MSMILCSVSPSPLGNNWVFELGLTEFWAWELGTGLDNDGIGLSNFILFCYIHVYLMTLAELTSWNNLQKFVLNITRLASLAAAPPANSSWIFDAPT